MTKTQTHSKKKKRKEKGEDSNRLLETGGRQTSSKQLGT